jgi:hypothetical protein
MTKDEPEPAKKLGETSDLEWVRQLRELDPEIFAEVLGELEEAGSIWGPKD